MTFSQHNGNVIYCPDKIRSLVQIDAPERIPAPDLEYALDNLVDEANSLCLMAKVHRFIDSDNEEDRDDPTDFSIYIDPVGLRLSFPIH